MKDPIDHDSDTKGSQARDKSVSDLSVRSLVIQSLAVTMLFGLLHFFMGWILRYWGVWLPPGIGPDTVPAWAVWAPLLPNEWFLIAIVAFVWFIRVVPRLIKYQESPLLVLAILAGGYCLLSTVSILIRGPGWNLSLVATFIVTQNCFSRRLSGDIITQTAFLKGVYEISFVSILSAWVTRHYIIRCILLEESWYYVAYKLFGEMPYGQRPWCAPCLLLVVSYLFMEWAEIYLAIRLV